MQNKFEIGDTVSFLNEQGGGKIRAIDVKGNYLVTMQDGFDVTFSGAELVLIKRVEILEKKSITAKSTTQIFNKNEAEHLETINKILIALEPVKPAAPELSNQKLRLFNFTKYDIAYNAFYFDVASKQAKNIKTSALYTNSNEEITEIERKEFDSNLTIIVHVIFFQKSSFDPLLPQAFTFEINKGKLNNVKAFKLYTFYNKPLFINEYTPTVINSANFMVDESLIISKLTDSNFKLSKSSKGKNTEEIDLHLEALTTDNIPHNSALSFQLQKFSAKLSDCLFNKVQELVVIHGVGNGILKNEVHKIIKEHKLFFHDAPMNKYGTGATVIKF